MFVYYGCESTLKTFIALQFELLVHKKVQKLIRVFIKSCYGTYSDGLRLSDYL